MAAPDGRVPTPAELRAFGLGQLDPQRTSEVEAHLAEHPECLEVVEATPDDEMMKHLRGAGALPKPRARPWLLQLAIEAVVPVLGGCAGALAGGPEGGLVGVAAGQVVEKGINFFGQRIVDKWRGWLGKQPPGLQAAALSELAEVAPEVARSAAAAVLAEQAPQASPADRQVAIDYLSAIPRSVRRSLLSGGERGGRQLPPTISADDSLSLLQLLPTDVPPYSAPTALPGTDYRLEELIGSGGFGAVYRASSPSLQHLPLAIKFCPDRSLLPALHKERENLERLMRAGGKTWSPNLVRLYGYNLDHRTPFLVYEYVPGGDLVHWLARRRARVGRGLTPAEVLGLITKVAEALAFAHQHGLVHRDLKPANVLTTGDGTIKLADFGIGGLVAGQALRASRIGTMASSRLSPAEQASLFRGAGTPLYMSREQKEGAAPDPRHDLYSLGVMWYQLLVGDVTREMAHGWSRELEKKFDVPEPQIELIERCVGLTEDRPRDAGELLPSLRELQKLGEIQIGADELDPGHEPEPEEVQPLNLSSDKPSGKLLVLSTPETERSRQIRFLIGLRKLLEGHNLVAWYIGMSRPIIQGILLGLLFGTFGGLVLNLFTRDLATPRQPLVQFPNPMGDQDRLAYEKLMADYRNAYNRANMLASWVSMVSGFGILVIIIWLRLRFWWKAGGRAERDLAAKIDQLLTSVPMECQAWGGRYALADREIVKEILRELDPPPR